MTSTSTSQGFNEDNRNSSRVLNPPGGISNVFFSSNEPSKPMPKKTQQKSQMSEIFQNNDNEQSYNKTKIEMDKTDNKENPSEAQNTTNNIKNNNNENGEETKKVTPTRKRVPPGGYSSGGFW